MSVVSQDSLTSAEFAGIKTAINSESFDVTFWDGEYLTKTMHTGDREYELLKAPNETDNRWSMSLSFIAFAGES